MNINKLFEMQKVLDDRIVKEHGLEGQDLLPKKILALQVELGECANEWRGFKMWSKDQEARTKRVSLCSVCDGTGDENNQCNLEDRLEGGDGYPYMECEYCGGTGNLSESNPLLEEYVDCLHFILSIGNEIKQKINDRVFPTTGVQHDKDLIIDRFIEISGIATGIYYGNEHFNSILSYFLDLGYMLGFTWDQIEEAYMSKNEVNHNRQDTGY